MLPTPCYRELWLQSGNSVWPCNRHRGHHISSSLDDQLLFLSESMASGYHDNACKYAPVIIGGNAAHIQHLEPAPTSRGKMLRHFGDAALPPPSSTTMISGGTPTRIGDKWHLDEVVISINGKKHWLRRAVDADGFVLDALVQIRPTPPAVRLHPRSDRQPPQLSPPRHVVIRLSSASFRGDGRVARER